MGGDMRPRPLLALLFFFVAGSLCCPAAERVIRVALFDDAGSAGKGVPMVAKQLGSVPGIEVTKLKAAAVHDASRPSAHHFPSASANIDPRRHSLKSEPLLRAQPFLIP
jgi:hypothetical protein